MKKQVVIIYELDKNAQQHPVVTYSYEHGKLTATGNQRYINKISQEGIDDYPNSSNIKFYPRDGIRFLELLHHNFNSTYLRATKIIERDS